MRFDIIERFSIPGCRISCYTFNENVTQFLGTPAATATDGFLDDNSSSGPASPTVNNEITTLNAPMKKELGEQLDICNFGTESGRLFFLTINHGTLPIHNTRPIEITKNNADAKHAAAISCMLFMSSKEYCNRQNLGILLSGSMDRSIKVWTECMYKCVFECCNTAKLCQSFCRQQSIYVCTHVYALLYI